MRILTISVFAVTVLWPQMGVARGAHDFGAGIVIGRPTGLTVKYLVHRQNAIDAAFSYAGSNTFYLHGSWLWLKSPLFDIKKHPVNWYLGIGSRLITHEHGHDNSHGTFGHHHGDHDDELHLAVRSPFGLRMSFSDPRVEVYGEFALAMDVVPEMDVDLDFGVGARYYF